MTKKPLKLEDIPGRVNLHEGRNFSLGFAFAEKVKTNHFKAAHAISPCKDYLNDVLWSEKVNKPSRACGLIYAKKNILYKPKSYLLAKICPSKNINFAYNSDLHKEEIKVFPEQVDNIKAFIKQIEVYLKLKVKSTFYFYDDLLLCSISNDWLKDTYGVSLLTYLIRVGRWCPVKTDFKTFLTNLKDRKVTILNDKSEKHQGFTYLVQSDGDNASSALTMLEHIEAKGFFVGKGLNNSIAPHSIGFLYEVRSLKK